MERTRDLQGRVLTKGTLKPYRAEALDFIEKYRNHPAVAAGLEYMAEWLAPDDSAGFLRGEFARVRARGATPETLLASFVAVWMWQSNHGQLGGACFDLNIGRAVLGTVPAESRTSWTGKKYYVRVRPRHAEALGRNMRMALGTLGTAIARKLAEEAKWLSPEERRHIIRKALEEDPLFRSR